MRSGDVGTRRNRLPRLWVFLGLLLSLFLAISTAPVVPAEDPPLGWQSADRVQAVETEGADEPAVAVAGNEVSFAVWPQSDGTVWNAWAARHKPGMGWEAPVLLEDESGSAQEVGVAADGEGNAVAVWIQAMLGGRNVYAATHRTDAGWDAAVSIEENVGDAFEPQVDLNRDGDGMAVWYQYDANLVGEIWAAAYAEGLGWDAAVRVDATGDESIVPQVGVDAQGRAIAVWLEWAGDAFDVWEARYVPGTGWSDPALLGGEEVDVARVRLAVDPTGNATAAWDSFGGTQAAVWAARYVVGQGWSAAVRLDDGTGRATRAELAVDPTGQVFAVWQTQADERDDVLASHYVPGSGWTSPTRIEDSPHHAFRPTVAADDRGRAVVLWQEEEPDGTSLWSSRYRSTDGWAVPVRVETLAANVSSPGLAVHPLGNATAVWRQGSPLNVWANRFLVDLVPPHVVLTSPTATLTNLTSLVVAGQTEPEAALTVNGAAVPLATNGSFSVTLSLPEGVHPIEIVAVDAEGNVRTLRLTAIVDPTPPVLELLGPDPDSLLHQSAVELQWLATDNTSGVDRVDVSLNGGALAVVSGTANRYVLEDVPDGSHVVTLRATDRAGNAREATVAFSVDTNPWSLTGPFGPFPLLGVITAATVGAVLAAWFFLRLRREPRG